MRNILCDNPKVILHPLAGEFLSRCNNYVVKGKRYQIIHRMAYYERYLEDFSPYRCHVSISDIDDCYFLDSRSGEVFPMYLLVKCGHCSNCRASKVNSLVHRCKLECQSYRCLPMFVTLTYANEPEVGVNVRDVQLFFKRFRQNLLRHGYFDKIRYLLVSEYGKNTHRAHYHAIIWNLHADDLHAYREVSELLSSSWKNGFTMQRLIDLKNDKCFRYTAKYLHKQNNKDDVPHDKNPTFKLSSNRNGGIGAIFVDSLAPNLRNTLSCSPRFLNRFTGQIEDLNMNSYIFNRFFPSFPQLLTSKVRSAVKRFCFNYCSLANMSHSYQLSGFSSLFDRIKLTFTPYMYIYLFEQSSVSQPYENRILQMSQLVRDASIIENFLSRHPDLSDLKRLSLLRDKVVLKLSQNSLEITEEQKTLRAERFEQLNSYLEQFEVF